MKKTIVIMCSVWLALVCFSFFWNYETQIGDQFSIALKTARSFTNQIIITREWNAIHGGVYVPVTRTTKPNKYLDDPVRDIQVNENLTLTKINPAYMTRQLSEIARINSDIIFHITSLNPIRMLNVPTLRETDALKQFEAGKKEVSYFFTEKGDKSFFYMVPLITSGACLKCHAKQGYKLNDVRGGISVLLPVAPDASLVSLVLGHLIIGVGGLVGIILLGVRLDKAYKLIQRQAVMDALTGIPNRRSFSETIVREFRRCQRDQDPLSVIICDVDNFKGYNDDYGHSQGDECLRKVAQAINDSLTRPGDFCARYGGEEFVVILPATPQDGARSVAEKIRENVQSLKVAYAKSQHQGVVTLSLGVATAVPDSLVTHEALIKQADAALYRAKKNGRNRVEVGSS